MLSRRTARPFPTTSTPGRRLAGALPALLLGAGALALAVPTTLPAAAAPDTGSAATSGPSTTSSTATAAKTSGLHLTAAAEAAGVQPGNAPMGWRQRGVERTVSTQQRPGLLRPMAEARSTAPSFTPKGTLGIDVSSYQGKIKWSTWTGKNKQFAYIKATEGTSYRNPYFKAQYKGAAGAGMIRGAYHFASPNGKAGYKQARYFVANGGGWSGDGHTLPGVLDIEYNPYGSTCYGLSKKKMVAWIHSFTAEYWKLTGRHAVIYSTTDWWKRCTGNDASFAGNPLWIARYGTTKPGTLPKSWTTATFWQYSANPIDQDVFPDKLKRLRAYATKEQVVAKG